MKTDLKKVKEEVKMLLRAVPIKVTAGMFTSHPMANTIHNCVPDENNKPKWVDISKEKDKQEWLKFCDKRIDECEKAHEILMFIMKPYRLTILKFCKPYIENKEFSELLSDAWVMSENPNDDKNCPVSELITWFRDADKRSLMSDKDYKVWESLPDEMILYRGVANGHNPKGLSWTLNREKAEWFRDRWKDTNVYGNTDRYLLQAKVKKKDCFCYFNTRGEDEIVVDTSKIKSKRVS